MSFEQLKERQRLAWGAAPFEKIGGLDRGHARRPRAQAGAAAGRAVAGRRLRDGRRGHAGCPAPAQT